MKQITREIIKSGAIVTLFTVILLFFGFISSFSQNRIIGISLLKGDINTYVESGGTFIIQSIQSLFKYPLVFEDLDINLYMAIAIILLSITIVFIKINSSLLEQKYRKITLVSLSLVILTIFIIITVRMYTPFYNVSSVIQPVTTLENKSLYKAKINKFKYSDVIVNKYLGEKFNNCEVENKIKCLFDLRRNLDPSARKKVYITLLQVTLLSTVLIILLTHWVGGTKNRCYKVLLFLFLFFQSISIPYIHGVIGANYTYPVVDVVIDKGEAKEKRYKGVVMLKEVNGTMYFLDRQNYMSIYQIERTNIKSIEQMAAVSLFVNCSQENDKVALCEEIFWQ